MDHPDKERFEQLLHAYELGMLTDPEEEEFELLLMEHPGFFEQVRRLDDFTLLIGHSPRARAVIAGLQGEKSHTPPKVTERAGQTLPDTPGRWQSIVPMVLAAAAVFLIFFITDVQIHFKPAPEAFARENRLVIMYFDNLTGRDDASRFGEIATNLLIADLSESPFIQVVSAQRLYDLLKLAGQEGVRVITKETATDIAERAGARWMLTGSILQVDPDAVLAGQLVDMASGSVIASQAVTGKPGEDIFSVIDRLAEKIRNDLSLPEAASTAQDRHVAEITTHSTEAYSHFLQGIDLSWKYYNAEAAAEFLRAVELDSTFAMAYYYLAGLENQHWIERAVRYIDRADNRGRYYISSRDALYRGEAAEARTILQQLLTRYPDEKDALYGLARIEFGQHQYREALGYLRQVVAIDSTYKLSYNLMAYAHDNLGEFENAIHSINTYIRLAPGEANPYDSRGEIYSRNGRLDSAIASYEKAVELKPQFVPAVMNLGILHVFRQEYDTAEYYFRNYLALSGKERWPTGRLYLAYPSIYQGKFDRALELLDYGIGADRLELAAPTKVDDYVFKFILKTQIFAEKGLHAQAVREFETYINALAQEVPGQAYGFPHVYVQLLVENGEETRAEEITATLYDRRQESPKDALYYWYARGCLDLAREDPDAAVEALRQAVSQSADFITRWMLARALLAAGEHGQAIELFETLLGSYTLERAFAGIQSVKTHYWLAVAYEQTGQEEQATDHFEEFLALWKDADPGISAVEDAESRLTQLKRLGTRF